MTRDVPTVRQIRVPMVLVVGGTPALSAVVEEAALAAQVLVTCCSLADLMTVAAETRPLVILVDDDIFAFDPESFEALARDVHSRVLSVRPEDHHVDHLEARLKVLMASADADDFEREPG